MEVTTLNLKKLFIRITFVHANCKIFSICVLMSLFLLYRFLDNALFFIFLSTRIPPFFQSSAARGPAFRRAIKVPGS